MEFTVIHLYSIYSEWWNVSFKFNHKSLLSSITLSIQQKLSPFPLIREREGRSDQLSSLSFILFIISLFHPPPVSKQPCRALSPRMMDWSRVRSHSSFTQSFILLNTIELHKQNAAEPISRVMREGRLERVNDLLSLPTPPWIKTNSTEQEICFIWLIFDIQNTEGRRDKMCSEGVI